MAEKLDFSKGFQDIYKTSAASSPIQNLNGKSRTTSAATYAVYSNANITPTSHINAGFQQDNHSDSAESDSSKSESESASDPEWIENVGKKGDLFYVGAASGVDDPDKRHSIFLDGKKKKHFKSKGKANLNENRIHLYQTPSGRTFQSVDGDIKEVTINVDNRKHNYGRRTTLCETLLGIIPGEVPDNRYEGSNWDSRRNRILVKGLAPDGEAIKTRAIKIGDYLKCIDDIEITAENLIQVLSKITTPRRVKIKIQGSIGSVHPRPLSPVAHSQIGTDDVIVKYISKMHTSFDEIIEFYRRIPHLFLLVRDSSNATDNAFQDGVLFKYPRYESTLLSLTGAFITMNQMSVDVTGASSISASLTVEECLVHVSYHRENRDLLVLAIPASCATYLEIQQIMVNLVRVLRWQFQSIAKAFEEKENQKALTQLFTLFYHNILSQSYSQQEECLTGRCKEYMECMPSLPLNSDVQVQLDNHLGELESGDFGDMSEAYYDEQRMYLIIGSCLFYKGLLCRSHLHKDDLTDVYMYCFFNQLLCLTKQEEVGQLIVWREVYPLRLANSFQENNLDFKEDRGRWFVLIMALNHSLLAVLMKTGGCTAIPEAHPPPDPFYVDQTRNTLLRMNTSGVTAVLERLFQSSVSPEITYADSCIAKFRDNKRTIGKQQMLNLSRSSSLQTLSWRESMEKRSNSQSNLLSSSPQKRQDVSTILKKRIQSHLDGEKQQLLSPSIHADGESDFDRSSDRNEGSSFGMEMSIQTSVSSNSDADSRTSSEDIYRGLKSSRIYGTMFDLSSLRIGLETAEEESSTRLITGCENTLFQYLTLDAAEGVLISPLLENHQCLMGPLHKEILKNFEKCVSEIHHVFQSTQKLKEPQRNCELFRNDRGIAPIKEHGVLFKLNVPSSGTKKASQFAYWVVGRILNIQDPKEVFVCFQDSVSQNAIEMAFKLSFGTLPV